MAQSIKIKLENIKESKKMDQLLGIITGLKPNKIQTAEESLKINLGESTFFFIKKNKRTITLTPKPVFHEIFRLVKTLQSFNKDMPQDKRITQFRGLEGTDDEGHKYYIDYTRKIPKAS